MRPVHPIDQVFLRLERDNQSMHVGSLQLFAPPAGAGDSHVRDLVARARQCRAAQPPFDRRLAYRCGQPFWVRDGTLDMAYHVRHLAVPGPGTTHDLFDLVSMLHSSPLDRTRPLWELHFIEGLADGRFAIYNKFHHALMDGVSAMRLMQRALNLTPDAELTMPWQLPRPGASERRQPGRMATAGRLLRTSAGQLAALPGAGRALARTWRGADGAPLVQAPRTILNAPVSGSRHFAAQSYPLDRIRRLARHYRATINDMAVAMCASALRRHLRESKALPKRPLVAMLPVSLRADDSLESGNRVAMIYASLATDVADPVARLAAIQRSVNQWKDQYRALSPQQSLAFAAVLAAPAGLKLLTGATPRHPSFNIVISNVPGPAGTLYLGEAELTGLYPVSIVLDGQALNISLTSYRDALEFGLTACRRALPDVQRLLDYLADALDELEPARRGARLSHAE